MNWRWKKSKQLMNFRDSVRPTNLQIMKPVAACKVQEELQDLEENVCGKKKANVSRMAGRANVSENEKNCSRGRRGLG